MTTVEHFAETVKYEFELIHGGHKLQKAQYELAFKKALEKFRQILGPEDEDSAILSENYSCVWIKEYSLAMALSMLACTNVAQGKVLMSQARQRMKGLEAELRSNNGVGSIVARG